MKKNTQFAATLLSKTRFSYFLFLFFVFSYRSLLIHFPENFIYMTNNELNIASFRMI